MLKRRRRSLQAAALAAFALLAPRAFLSAQETNTVGPPQLKDFQLSGERTTPPAQATPPAMTPSPAARTPAADARPPAVRTPPPAAAPAARPAPAQRSTPAPAASASSPPRDAAPQPARIGPLPAEPAPAPVTAPPAPPGSVPPGVEPAPRPAAGSGSLLWLGLGALLLLGLAALAVFRRRRAAQRRLAHRHALAGSLLGEEPPAAPEVEPERAEPVLPGAPGAAPIEAAVEPRAWLELDIKPERAAATDREAVVNYELVLRNTGEAQARNIRIDARMFNAGADGEIADFFAGPIHALSGSPHISIRPGGELRIASAIAMPKEQARAIEVQGRAIFVPMIAINVAYDFGDAGSGRSSRSWLVGRETEAASAKMGPFRLDLGPRIYRQVGRREDKRVMV